MMVERAHFDPDDDAALRVVEYALAQTERAPRTESTNTAFDPDSFTGYELGPLIHRGGQGIVFRAVQRSTGKTVALKVLRDGLLASDSDRARMKREAQVLVRLKHPNIVGISDTGIAAGHNYFVMDFVDGVALDEFVRASSQPLRATLELFANVCEAVHAAHLKGIVHRDLKPSNIRVTADGVPQVLDFGMAKVIDRSDPAVATMTVTETGQFVGSLPWAAPEQARGEWNRVDARTDVYSLGVILYQLVTGTFPYAVMGPMADVISRIIHSEPQRPNHRNKRIDGELETIILTCLHKEPQRRYENAGALAKDLRRYIAGEAIDAKGDSAWYVLRKKARRYRVAAVVLGTGLALATAWGIHAMVLLQRATTAERRSERDAAIAEQRLLQVQEVVQAILDEVSGRLSRVGGTADARRDLLQFAYAQLQPLVADAGENIALQASLGRTYFLLGDLQLSLGETELGRSHLEEALAIRRELVATEPEVLAHLADLSINLVRMGDSFAFVQRERRRPYYEEALTIDEDIARRDPHNTRFLDNLACSYERMGWLARDEGRPDEAREWHQKHHQLFEKLVALDPDNATRLHGLYTASAELASQAENVGDSALALERYSKAYELISRIVELEPDRPVSQRSFIETSLSYAYALRLNEDTAEARAVLDDAYDMAVRLTATDDGRSGHLDHLAAVCGALAEWATSVADRELSMHYRFRQGELLESFLALHPDRTSTRIQLATSLVSIADLKLTAGRESEARQDYIEAADLAREVAEQSESAAELADVAFVMRRITDPTVRDLSIGIAAADKAVELTNGQWYIAWRELAECLAADGQADKARFAQAMALDIAPFSATVVRDATIDAIQADP